MPIPSLPDYKNNFRSSSILDDDSQFDHQHLIDGKLETCWNSDEGETQYIYYKFSKPVSLSHFELTFQGGFGAEHIAVSVGVPITDDMNTTDDNNDDDSDDEQAQVATKRKIGLKAVAEFNSSDASSTQSFSFTANGVYAVKFTFTRMADMFGRVILYNLNIYGEVEN